MNIYSLFHRYRYQVLLLLIVILGIFLRSYAAIDRFEFAHDGDLYSWIVKDIVINGHFRLIGQLTSTQGIFIGPLFYYLLVPFFLVSNMDPVGALGLGIFISVVTIVSFYYIFKKLFNRDVGLIAAFLQATLLGRVSHDRWIVPTITTSLWEVWYFYVILMICRGNFNVLPILGVLVGLIWHINFSEAPILILIPIAIILSKKLPKLKEITLAGIGFVIPSLPLFMFEIRHNFIQTSSLINSFLIDQGEAKGFLKLTHVLKEVGTNISGLFLYPFRGYFEFNLLFMLLILLLGILLTFAKILSKRELIILYIWFISMIGFFAFSSKIISEYYFSNIDMVFLGIIILAIYLVYKKTSKLIKLNKIYSGGILMLLIFFVFSIRSLIYLVNFSDYDRFGYNERKDTAGFIKQDAVTKNFPCVSVSYITTPGNNVGFRYFFYLDHLNVNRPSSGDPVYTIVIPPSLAENEVKMKFGNIGIIPPQNSNQMDKEGNTCGSRNDNLSDPLFGYVE